MRKSSTISKGSTIKIIYCRKLQEYGLINLVGQTAVITECLFDNKNNPGAYVIIIKGINKGEEWFIPLRSIQTRESINKLRSDAILRQIP